MKFYSPSAGGFYAPEIHATIPEDALELTEQEYQELLEGLNSGKQIVIEDGHPVLQVPVITLEAMKADLLEAATRKRFEVETGGITLPGGVQIGTDREDQNAVANAVSVIGLTGLTSVDFKARSGWVTIGVDQLSAIAAAVGLHKQACFTAERTHHEAIAALTTKLAAQAYNVNTGWPGQ